MSRNSRLAFPLALTLLAASLSAQPVAVGKSQPRADRDAVPAVQEVLWFQNDQDSGVGIVSQNFESSFDAYDVTAADDFVVTEGETWVVRQVQVTGTYFNGSGPARSENIAFYGRGSRVPGKLIKAYPAVVGVPDGPGGFLITLPEPLTLEPGRYWVAVQVNMDFVVGGEWGWETRSTRKGIKSAWKNRFGGFGTDCNHYKHMDHCIGEIGQGPDFMFSLLGDRTSR